MLAAGLLLARRTATLGAIVAIGVLANVVAVNLCFDVPVKLFSMTLMVMALYLFADDLGRFVDAMVRNRATAPAELRPHFVGKVGRRVHVAVKAAWISLCLVCIAYYWNMGREHHAAPKPALYGLYEVESFTSGGVARPPLVGDELRWRHFIVEAHGGAVVRTMDGRREDYALAVDEAERSFTLTLRKDDREQVDAYTYEQPDPASLVLHGSRGAGPLDITLRRVDASGFLLVSRGFHWVNEAPLNR